MLPAADSAAFEERASSTYISPPFFTQATISEFIDQGRFGPNLERVREGLRARRDAMLEALEAAFPERSSWSRPEGGYFLWLDLGDGGDVADLAQRADDEAVAFVPGTDFFPRGSELGASSARLAFSYEPPERIREGIERLGSLLGATV